MKATGARAQSRRVSTFAGVVLCGAAVLAASSSALAQDDAPAATESLYVIEHLVVSVNAAADGSGERVGQIQSGDKVEVLERQGDQARVRISSGNEGWVRTSYLSQSPPMRDQLKARTDELEKVRQEKSKLESELQTARKAASEAAAAARAATPPEATPPPAAVTAAAEPIPSQSPPSESASDPSPASTPPLFASEGLMPRRPSWIFALVAAAAALAIGFALGWRMLDRRIRAKYGGLRIY
jgi:hypothetical protein